MARKSVTVIGDGVRQEYTAQAAITPGHLIELRSDGKVQAHSTAGGNAQTRFAFENDLAGKEIGDAYAAGDKVQANTYRKGDVVLAILKDGETAVIGSLLESAGDGTLQVHVPDSGSVTEQNNQIVGEARTAVDMSDSSAADPSARIEVEIW